MKDKLDESVPGEWQVREKTLARETQNSGVRGWRRVSSAEEQVAPGQEEVAEQIFGSWVSSGYHEGKALGGLFLHPEIQDMTWVCQAEQGEDTFQNLRAG